MISSILWIDVQNMNKTELKQALSYPGLSEKEVSVYLASLEQKEPTPLTLAKETGLPRPTVYRILESLVEKGLVGKVTKGKRVLYVPEDPRAIVSRLKLQASSVQNVMSELRDLATIYRNRPTMRFFEGREGMKRVCEDVLSTNEKELLSFSSIEDLFTMLPDYFPAFVKSRIRKGMSVRVLAPKSKKGEERKAGGKKEMREIRFVSNELAEKIGVIHGHTFVYADRIAFISFDSDQNSIIIENPALADLQRALFEVAWSASEN